MHGTVVGTKNKESPIPDFSLEIPMLNVTHIYKIILEKKLKDLSKSIHQDLKTPSELMKMLISAAMKRK